MRVAVPAVVFALLLCVIAIVPSVWADPVPITLFNTGVGTDGNLVPDGGVDPHYSLIASADPSFPGPNTYTLMNPGTFPLYPGFWTPNTSISKWIAPDPNNYVSYETGTGVYHTTFAQGYYAYQTTFYLPHSFNSKKDTAAITGLWATDNTGFDILINGLSTGNYIPFYSPEGVASWHDLHPLSITGGFDKGLNTLEFIIWEGGASPTGLHVQMTGTYDLKPIPEPTTFALVGMGILSLFTFAGLSRRRGRF